MGHKKPHLPGSLLWVKSASVSLPLLVTATRKLGSDGGEVRRRGGWGQGRAGPVRGRWPVRRQRQLGMHEACLLGTRMDLHL